MIECVCGECGNHLKVQAYDESERALLIGLDKEDNITFDMQADAATLRTLIGELAAALAKVEAEHGTA